MGFLQLNGRRLHGKFSALKIFFVGCAMIALALTGIPSYSQSSTGRILGRITDQSGGVVSGAPVAVTNVQTGVTRSLTTDDAGEYTAPNLVPGKYSVHVSATGFKGVDRQDLVLEIGKDIRIDLQLTAGEVSQTIEVTGSVPLIDTTGVTLGGTLSNDTINELPLNGRNYINLLSLRPGVQQYPGGGAWTQASNGLRVEDQNWIIDGLDNNETTQGQPVINSPGTAGDSATILPIDAIQEFNVEENPKAEFGWKPGAVVNIGLKSGTNQLHGTAYAFGRAGSWDANNVFNQGPQTPVGLEQWGVTAGGHIIKNKLFYFGGFENQRYELGIPQLLVIPSSSASASEQFGIPAASTALANAGVPLNDLSLKLLPLFGSTSDPNGNVLSSTTETNNSYNTIGKVDYNLSTHHTVSVSYFFGNDNNVSQDFPVTQPQFLSTFHIRTQALAGHYTWAPSASWVNELRVGFVRYNRPVQSVDNAVPATHYGINTGVTNPAEFGSPTIIVGGFSAVGAFFAWPNRLGPDNNYDVLDQVSYLHGKHAFKFGGEIRLARMLSRAYSNGRGSFFFFGGQPLGADPATAIANPTPLESFLAGAPSLAKYVVGDPVRNYRQHSFAAFAQDDWRITPKLTLNLGLRWEYTAPLSEANNLIANWTPSQGLIQDGKGGIGSVYDRQKTNFAPRVGAAWDLSGKGTTVLRAGFGMFYDLLPVSVFTDQAIFLQNSPTPGIGRIPTGALFGQPDGSVAPGPGTINTAAFTAPGGTLNWSVAGPVLPSSSSTPVACGDGVTTVTSGPPALVNTAPGPCSILAVDPHFRTPYVLTWSLSLQHAFTNSLSLELAYIGNHGGNLTGVQDVNQLNPQSPAELACGHCEANADRPYAAKYPDLGVINVLGNPYRSNYDGFQATFTGRDYHGMSFVAGYTYAHALDNNAFSVLNHTAQDSTNPGAEYGNSDFDARHRFTLSASYKIPGIKSPAQLLQGWQINTIVTIQGSQPWNAFDTGNDVSRTGERQDRWDFFGNPKDFKSLNTVGIPYFAAGDPTTPAVCLGHPNTTLAFGCYAQGNSAMLAPTIGTFGTMGRNIFRDTGYRNVDFSVFKNFTLKERYSAQFRAEFFNVFNHPNFANPWGSVAQYGTGNTSDASVPGRFGCSCQTPDVAATNPVLGSGGARAIQLGLKLIF